MSRGPNVRRGEVVHATEDWSIGGGAGREFICRDIADPDYLIPTDEYTDAAPTCADCRRIVRRDSMGRAKPAPEGSET